MPTLKVQEFNINTLGAYSKNIDFKVNKRID